MAIAASSLLLLAPVAPPSRLIALRPVASADAGARAGTGPPKEAEELREAELFRLRAEPAEGRSSDAGPDRGSPAGRSQQDEGDDRPEGEIPSFLGATAAFMAQLFAADEPDEARKDPAGEAARAYGRFREERLPWLMIDARDPIDVEV